MNGPEIEFDWDEANVGHLARHSVLPEEAEQVIHNNPVDLGMEIIEREERYLNLGATLSSRGDNMARRSSTRGNGVRAHQAAHSVLLPRTREVIHYGQETTTLQD
jgi:hypothetical protein